MDGNNVPQRCFLSTSEWVNHVHQTKIAHKQMEEAHVMIKDMHVSSEHLGSIAGTLSEIKDKFIDAILGKQIVPLDVHKALLEGQRASYVTIIKWICGIFGSVVTAGMVIFKVIH